MSRCFFYLYLLFNPRPNVETSKLFFELINETVLLQKRMCHMHSLIFLSQTKKRYQRFIVTVKVFLSVEVVVVVVWMDGYVWSLVGEDFRCAVRGCDEYHGVSPHVVRHQTVRPSHHTSNARGRSPDVQNLLGPLLQGIAAGLHHSYGARHEKTRR